MVFGLFRARSKDRPARLEQSNQAPVQKAPEPPTQTENVPDPLLDGGYGVLRRSVLIFSNFRSGTQMLRSSLVQLSDLQTGGELFARANTEPGAFSDYIAHPDTDLEGLLRDPERHLPFYLAYRLSTLEPSQPAAFDVKYSQAARLGVDDLTLAPTILKYFAALHVPVLHVIRRDVVAQAISHLLANKRGRFFVDRGAPAARPQSVEPIWLNPTEVCVLASARREEQRRAQAYLKAVSADVCTLYYEDLAGPALVPELQRTFRFLDRYARIPLTYQPPTRAQNSRLDIANRNEIYDMAMERFPGLAG
jgi:hypothetical protein